MQWNRRDYRFAAIIIGVMGLILFTASAALGGANWWASAGGLVFMGLAVWIWIQN